MMMMMKNARQISWRVGFMAQYIFVMHLTPEQDRFLDDEAYAPKGTNHLSMNTTHRLCETEEEEEKKHEKLKCNN